MSTSTWRDAAAPPSVSVVVPTRNRPELVRRALRSIVDQDYDGTVDVLVVFDGEDPDPTLARLADGHERRSIAVTTNSHTPGLAGGRNTGITSVTGDLVAFCDDDDEWYPPKLTAQVAALRADPAAGFACTGVEFRYQDHRAERIPEPARLTPEGFAADRMTEVHPSSFLIDRRVLTDEIGPVDEDLPGSYAEDYDLLLRAAAVTRIAVAPGILTVVHWHQSSFFSDRWATIHDALERMVDKHEAIAGHREGLARIRGQQAFALASMGERRRAWRRAWETVRIRPAEKRAWLAAVTATGVVPPKAVLNLAHRFGRGI